MDLLDEKSVIEYVKSRGIFPASAVILVEVLTGGISNVVLGLEADGVDLVLKQALPELKVASIWKADQRRAIVEADALQVFRNITPNNVPKLIDSDPEHFTLVLQRASRDVTNWKEDLLRGAINPKVAGELGRILGLWHKHTANSLGVLNDFEEDLLFEQLRITPFYRAIANEHAVIVHRIEALILELESDKSCLVHGDFSPKNILVTSSHEPIILDFEVAHAGNPVFDLAFLLGHLLVKFENAQSPAIQSKLAHCASAFLTQYQDAFRAPSPNLSWHVAAIALARVDGVSTVSYLSLEAQENLRNTCLGILESEDAPSIAQIFSEL